MAYTTRIAWEPLRSFNSASLTGSYQAIGTPLVNPAYILKMTNSSTSLVTVSIDGVTDIDVAPANSFWLYDELKTREHEGIPAGTQVFIKGSAGTGNIYLVSQYLTTN